MPTKERPVQEKTSVKITVERAEQLRKAASKHGYRIEALVDQGIEIRLNQLKEKAQ